MTDPRPLEHRPGCSQPLPNMSRRADGSLKIQCPGCRAWFIQGTEDTTEPQAITGYVCRDHHDVPVSWTGKGCRRCETVRSAWQRQRRNKRAKARQAQADKTRARELGISVWELRHQQTPARTMGERQEGGTAA